VPFLDYSLKGCDNIFSLADFDGIYSGFCDKCSNSDCSRDCQGSCHNSGITKT
jgi:hypothetical protein